MWNHKFLMKKKILKVCLSVYIFIWRVQRWSFEERKGSWHYRKERWFLNCSRHFKKCNVSCIEIKQLEVINYKYSSLNIVSFFSISFSKQVKFKNTLKSVILFFQRNYGNRSFCRNRQQWYHLVIFMQTTLDLDHFRFTTHFG